MRLALLTALALFLAPLEAEAKYIPLDLDDLLGKSDLVLHGKIIALNDTTFELKIEEVFAGEYSNKTIVVRRFQDWACAQRWTPYQEKQHLLLCLKRDKDPRTGAISHRIRSGGAEGEIPIVGTDAYVHGPSRIKIQMKEHANVYGGKIRARKVPLKELERITRLKRAQRAAAGANPHRAPDAIP